MSIRGQKYSSSWSKQGSRFFIWLAQCINVFLIRCQLVEVEIFHVKVQIPVFLENSKGDCFLTWQHWWASKPITASGCEHQPPSLGPIWIICFSHLAIQAFDFPCTSLNGSPSFTTVFMPLSWINWSSYKGEMRRIICPVGFASVSFHKTQNKSLLHNWTTSQ